MFGRIHWWSHLVLDFYFLGYFWWLFVIIFEKQTVETFPKTLSWCQFCGFYTVVSKECIPLISATFSTSIMEEIFVGMHGFVVFNRNRMSPNVMLLVSYTCFGNSYTWPSGAWLLWPVILFIYQPLFLASTQEFPQGFYWRWWFPRLGYLPAGIGFETTSLFFQTLISQWSPSIFSVPEYIPSFVRISPKLFSFKCIRA